MPVELLPSDGGKSRKEFVITGRFVFIALATFFIIVASVNAVMMTLAIKTFPGADARNGYDVSQGYNREIAAARQQEERGWASAIAFTRQGEGAQVALSLKDKAGAAVSGLAVSVRIKHPSDRNRDHVLTLREPAPGAYEAVIPAITDGAWELAFEAKTNGERVFVLNSKANLKG